MWTHEEFRDEQDRYWGAVERIVRLLEESQQWDDAKALVRASEWMAYGWGNGTVSDVQLFSENVAEAVRYYPKDEWAFWAMYSDVMSVIEDCIWCHY